MSVVSLIAFGICLGIVGTAVRRGADVLSPARVYGFVWALAIGLADLKFSRLQFEWSGFSWLMLLLGVLSFLVGTLIAYVMNLGNELVPIEDMRIRLRKVSINSGRLFRSILAFFFLYILAYIIIAAVKGFIPALIVRASELRTEFSMFGLGLFIQSLPFILLFIVLYFVFVRRCPVQKTVLVIIFLTTVGTYLLLLQRFVFLMWLVITLAFLYYVTRSIRFRTFLVGSFAIGLLFYGIQSFRFARYIQNYLYVVSRMKFSGAYAALTEPYMYIAMNLENFARGVEKLETFTYGYYTFDFLLALTGLKHWIAKYFNLVERPFIFSSYNTFPYFWVYYRDFGSIGLVVGPLLLGLIIGLLYYRMRVTPTLTNVSLYSIAVFVMVISFFINPLTMLFFVFNIAVIYFVVRFISAKTSFFPQANSTTLLSTA